MYSYNDLLFFQNRPGLAESISKWEANGCAPLYAINARESTIKTENYLITFGKVDTYYYLGTTSENQDFFSAFPDQPLFLQFLHYGWKEKMKASEEGLKMLESIIIKL